MTSPACRFTPLAGEHLWRYDSLPGGHTHRIGAPAVQLDGARIELRLSAVTADGEATALANGQCEQRWTGPVAGNPGLSLVLVARSAAADPVVRFRCELHSETVRRMTRSAGADDLTHLGIDLAGLPEAAELRLSEFDDRIHSYVPNEVALAQARFDRGHAVMGPILLASGGGHQLLVAYEHGSQHPEAFLRYHLAADRQVALRAVKGNYWHGQEIGPGRPWCSLWYEIAAIDGTRDDLAAAYRRFVLTHLAVNQASRQPWIFYNTWNHQERRKAWQKQPYLSQMNLERMLAEVDAAHRMGIEVFVIDTGWYEKTGDWRVSGKRFPDELKQVKARLDGYGMRLGLWFAPTTVAMTSRILAGHQDCLTLEHGQPHKPVPVWETEDSTECCIVSRYGDAFADELIRIHRELGVSYFKWDAIGQYWRACDGHGHGHGGAGNDEAERRDCYAFQQPMALARVVERVQAAVPDAICDFDVTEGGRAVGLAFLAASKFFLINNGPYFGNYDNPNGADGNSNLFFFPGPARTWICRASLGFDRWIPSVLFLTHYLPDDPAENQLIAIGSLILGHNGIWGDLPGISREGQDRFGEVLGWYKQVRDAVTAADPVREGIIAGDPEVHEKLSGGRGVVVVFAAHAGTYRYVTRAAVDPRVRCTANAEVAVGADGLAEITVTLAKASAAICVFGSAPVQ